MMSNVNVPSEITPEGLKKAVAGIAWKHTMDLGRGVVTSSEGGNLVLIKRLGLPERVDGLSVLDVGAWDGFFSFEAERRGARRVLATDSFQWDGGGWGTKTGFELARRALGSRVEDRTIDVLDISPETVGTFDLVLFLGVLYHMRHPLLALERVASVTGQHLILETVVDMLQCTRPAAAFYFNAELAHDKTSWFGPNIACVTAMLRNVGFQRVTVIYKPSLLRRLARAAWWRLTRRGPFLRTINQGRLVVHAWR
jgi:tRNA (mo5U34)-methyltransferase